MKTKAAASPRVLCFLCNSDTTESKPKRQRRRETLSVKVRLEEFICDIDNAKEDSDKHFGLFVWPAALVLSRFIAYEAHWLCRDKIILELGCGTGLPSILAGVCGASRVYLTDRPDAVDIHRNVETNIKLNGLETRATFLPLAWGEMHLPKEMMSIFRTVHVILAADCFYHSEGLASPSPLPINATI
ncbi:hypothetical protein PsorP6_016392 [Peronosclerospora sorghi]|uniref:Uncharacterized protein n=1 Tax=Peronosclerospora sorghi TaxID=230839 RepID=A0ACC0VIR7_9STRA|nr:hypothetical protein PsorP6_016392 [Peronosclerospora sorghi]